MTTKRTNHSVYNLNYHLVFVTKYRNQVLVENVETYVKERVGQLCIEYGFELLEVEVMSDHLHLFVSAPPKVAPVRIAQILKSKLALSVFQHFPTLKKRRFWGSGLWSRGCYYGSAGTVSAATIQRYIKEQKLC